MAVLVTGGAGYVGSHLVWELLDEGEDVIVLDNLSTGFEWAVAPEARLVVGDVGDVELVTSILLSNKVDAIFHFAGSLVVPDSVSDPLSYYANNTIRTHALVAAAVRASVSHFIFSSSAAVYGASGAEPVSEDASLSPTSPYGRSKLVSEWILADAAQAHGLTYAALRYFNVAGADPRGRAGESTRNATHLIKVACQTALGARPSLQIFGTDYPTPDGTCVRDYIHVSDLAAVHRLALARLRGGGGNLVANCGYSRGYSVLEVIDSVRRVHGADFPVTIAGRRSGDPAATVADASLVRSELGWLPAHDDLDEIVRHALAWETALMRRNIRRD